MRAEFLFKWMAEEIAVLKNVPEEPQRLGRVMQCFSWHEKIHDMSSRCSYHWLVRALWYYYYKKMFRLASEYMIIVQAGELSASKHQRHFNLILRDENRWNGWKKILPCFSFCIFLGRKGIDFLKVGDQKTNSRNNTHIRRSV